MSQVVHVEQGLRFPGSHQVPEKTFETVIKKDLPRLIKKCEGMCDKVIRPDDDGLLVQSYGTSMQADRKTGQKIQVWFNVFHFNLQYLETFGRENDYGPGKRFQKNSGRQLNTEETYQSRKVCKYI